MKKLLFTLLSVLISSLIAIGAAELFIRSYAYDAKTRSEGAEKLWKKFRNGYVEDLKMPDSSCSFSDSLAPHPFLGFVQNESDCGNYYVNNRGINDPRDIPSEKDPGAFTILLVGGSVASQMALGKRGIHHFIWLEDELNRRYISPNGKPFRILSGAVGSWRMPTQAVMTTLYAPYVDAVVGLDGYNEATNTAGGLALDLPDTLNYIYVARSPVFGSGFRWIWLLQSYRRISLQNRFLRRSFLAYFAFEKFMGLAANEINFGDRYKNLDKFFALPNDWSSERRAAWNRGRYENYIKMISAQTKAMKIYYAHFLQPNRVFGKELTMEEKQYPELITEENYRAVFLRAYTELKSEGYPIVSLQNVFEGHKETIYGDLIHCKFSEDGDNLGYRIMSSKMAEALGTLWHLKAKAN
jgi:hypothetical protein